jgi:hypothetical protein
LSIYQEQIAELQDQITEMGNHPLPPIQQQQPQQPSAPPAHAHAVVPPNQNEYKVDYENHNAFIHDQLPDYMVCPITTEIMEDPVMDLEGNTFDRHAIYEWLDAGNIVSH